MNSKFKIQNSRFSGFGSIGKISKLILFILLILAADGGQWTADIFADVYAPADSIVLTVGCLDTTFLNIANPDSVWFKWWRDVGGQTLIDSAKVTSGVRTGFFRKKIKASDVSNNYGTYIAEAIVYKTGKTGMKTWCWTVKAEFDSVTKSIPNLLQKGDSSLYMRTDWANIKNKTATNYFSDTRIYKADFTGNVDSTNAVNRLWNNFDTTNYSLTSVYMTKGDSSLYMRTDWANIKNPTTYQNFSQTHFHFVDSLGEEISVTVDSPSIARSVWNENIVPRQNRRIRLADSIGEEIVAQVDTSQIKTMNENNQWGASYTWNYSTRTLTSGAGSGANSVVIRCKQAGDSSHIAFAQIQVLDSTENSTIGLLTSDSQGRGFFALNNGIYCVRLYKPGWQFTVPETLKVNGNEDTIYYADAFDPGSPPQASLCRVYGWIYDINNQPVAGAKIQASIKIIPLRYENVVISPYYQSTTTDDEGYWYLDLYPNSALNPSDTKYIFFIYSPSGTILKIETAVPNQSSWELQF